MYKHAVDITAALAAAADGYIDWTDMRINDTTGKYNFDPTGIMVHNTVAPTYFEPVNISLRFDRKDTPIIHKMRPNEIHKVAINRIYKTGSSTNQIIIYG